MSVGLGRPPTRMCNVVVITERYPSISASSNRNPARSPHAWPQHHRVPPCRILWVYADARSASNQTERRRRRWSGYTRAAARVTQTKPRADVRVICAQPSAAVVAWMGMGMAMAMAMAAAMASGMLWRGQGGHGRWRVRHRVAHVPWGSKLPMTRPSLLGRGVNWLQTSPRPGRATPLAVQ
jgi:hypothetical protein